MKYATLFFCILGLLGSASVSAQSTTPSVIETPDNTQSFMLHGRILDSETGLPLPYATISVNQLGIGTASNQDGDWSLHIPAAGSNAKLSINFMGYTPQVHNIANLSETSTIKLYRHILT